MKILGALLVCCGFGSGALAAGADPLASGFANPPNSARPRVWWHWMNGNITQEGITADLEWMSRVGIGGLQNFDAALETPQIVPQRLAYMTPGWKEAFRHAVSLAKAHDLELAIAASPGWSETGGPWVEPRDGMKKLVWSERTVRSRFDGVLPPLPETTGPFQDTPAIGNSVATDSGKPLPTYHADIAVLAFPVSDESAGSAPLPAITTNQGPTLDAKLLTDGSFVAAQEVPRGSSQSPACLNISFQRAQMIRSATLALKGSGRINKPTDVAGQLQSSEDGVDWRDIAAIPLRQGIPTTVSFAPVSGRLFRIVLTTLPAANAWLRLGAADGAVGPAPQEEEPSRTIPITELRLSGAQVVDRFEAKAGFSVIPDYYALGAPAPEGPAVQPGSIVDLTDQVSADGHLRWNPPKGRWRIVRLGYTLTGTVNHPASAEGTGLEVDKFDRAAVHRYLEHYLELYARTTGPELIGKSGLRAIVTDSTEVGPSNWTPQLLADFKRLRGYNPRPWLLALTGVVVGSRAQSDAFLYDFRQTLTDLVSTEHYAEVARVAHEHGLTVYGEALEGGRSSLGNDIAMRRYTDIPMAALWTYRTHVRYTLLADMKGAASVAHLYGQNLAAAESLTSGYSPWAHAPSDLKTFMDLEFASGINRPVIHTSVHQPVNDKLPGLSLLIYGQYFNRHETWAEMARPWVDYIARSSFLLQQGRYFADVAYFFGEDAPLTALYDNAPVADAPKQYGYDFVDADAVCNSFKVENGELATASGMRYRVLYLGGSSRYITLKTMRCVAALAEAGATVVGERPERSPSLADSAPDFASATAALWSGGGTTILGKGRIIAGHDVEKALTQIGIEPDFQLVAEPPDTDLRFLHRHLADAEIYFVNNRGDRSRPIEVRFRVTGKEPEIWYADAGTATPVSYRTEGEGTVVPLSFQAQDAFFVVFRKPARQPSNTVPGSELHSLLKLQGPWDVTFQPGRGAPPSIRLATLESLSSNADTGIRYFSGVATYKTPFNAPKGVRGPVLIDLGDVGDVAEVRLNGQVQGTAWKKPYIVPIHALHSGKNELEVRVADLWVNRLIGDAQPGAQRVTFTTVPTYRADAPLRRSGLIGPVSLLQAVTVH